MSDLSDLAQLTGATPFVRAPASSDSWSDGSLGKTLPNAHDHWDANAPEVVRSQIEQLQGNGGQPFTPEERAEADKYIAKLGGAPTPAKIPDSLKDLASLTGADGAAPARDVDISVKAPPKSGVDLIPAGANTAPTVDKPETAWDKVKGLGEAAANTIGAIPAGAAANAVALGKTIASGKYGTEEGSRDFDKYAGETSKQIMDWITHGPMTQAGQRYAGAVSDAVDATGIAGVAPIAELQALGRAAGPAKQFIGDRSMAAMKDAFDEKARIEPTMPEKPRFKLVDGKPVEVVTPRDVGIAVRAPDQGAPILHDEAPASTPGFDDVAKPEGINPALHDERKAVLARVGLKTARDSAIEGDVMHGATDYQLGKFEEPVGAASKAQFEDEKQTLANHAANIIKDAGGTVGTDESDVLARGRVIDKPFQSLGKWFDKGMTEMYGAADERSKGLPTVSTEPIDRVLNDPEFLNAAMADDKMGLVNGIKAQLDLHKERNGGNLTVRQVEDFNQFVNKRWKNDNKHIIGAIRDAADDAVTQSAGEDVYGQARALNRQKNAMLSDPKGLARIFDVDPNNTLNRATPVKEIADRLTNMDPDNFRNVIDTLQKMPRDIQPEAQAALAEIRGHLGNKLLDAGTKSKSVDGLWSAPAVSDVIKANREKLNIAFAHDPKALQNIRDLESAGKILQVNASYPGASAQAANAIKQGAMSSLLSHSLTATGATVGSQLGFPAAGALLGNMAGKKVSGAISERAALRKFQKNTTKLSEIGR